MGFAAPVAALALGAAPLPALAAAGAGAALAAAVRARPKARPLVALVPAVLAALLAPAAAPLIAIAGARLVLEPGPAPRPRWVVAVPLAGLLAVVLASILGLTRSGFAELWFGAAARPISPPALAALA